MNLGLDNAAKGLPAVVGVLLGVLAYGSGAPAFAIIGLVLLGAVGWISKYVGTTIFPTNPFAGRIVIEFWVITAIAVMALTTMLVIWVSLVPLADWLHLNGTADDKKALSGALSGAVATYAAFVWTKDIGDAGGFFWPSTAFQTAIGKAFKQLPAQIQARDRLKRATYDDAIAGIGEVGWDFSDRGKRTLVFVDESKP